MRSEVSLMLATRTCLLYFGDLDVVGSIQILKLSKSI